MHRKCKRLLKRSVPALIFSSCLLMVFFTLSTVPSSPVAKKVADVVVRQYTRSTETMPPRTKKPTHSTVNFTGGRRDSSPIIPSGIASVCLKREIINSSKINKLGSYPQEKRFLTIGISSITRPSRQSYFVKTISLLIDSLSDKDSKEVFMVIFLADFDETRKTAALTELSNLFKTFIDQNLLHVIFAPQEYYPPLSNLKSKFGDSRQRIFWRSKLVVDFSFLMCYCKDLSQYYLHLEDDIIPAPSFYPKLRDFITSQKAAWPILDAASMGFTAKVFHSSDLKNIATYFYLLYDEMPGDWLIIFWRNIKYDGKHYKEFVLPPASFFQHIGHTSSFIENKNSFKFEEKYFDQYDIKYKGLNPSATVSSSMSSNDGTKPEHAYNKGSGYFWAKGAKKDDFITIKFSSATTVREVFVETGSYLAPKDHLKSGVLQASFQNEGVEMETNVPANCQDFKTIGHFENGRVKVSLNESEKLFCVRVLVTKYQTEWLFVREIDIWQP